MERQRVRGTEQAFVLFVRGRTTNAGVAGEQRRKRLSSVSSFVFFRHLLPFGQESCRRLMCSTCAAASLIAFCLAKNLKREKKLWRGLICPSVVMLIMLSFCSHVHDDELGKFRGNSLVRYVDRNLHLKQVAAPIAVLGIQQMQNLLTHMGQGGSLLFQTSAFDTWTSSLSIAKCKIDSLYLMGLPWTFPWIIIIYLPTPTVRSWWISSHG